MASEYKKRGGGYNEPKSTGQDESQKHLSQWGEEEWQTKEGSGTAKEDDGSRKRYLPKKAWEEMSEKEKEETEGLKKEGGKEGKQFVANSDRAKEKREKANIDGKERIDKKKKQEQNETKTDDEKEGDDHAESEEGVENEDKNHEDSSSMDDGEDETEEKESSTGARKRTRTTRSATKEAQNKSSSKDKNSTPTKKQKTSNQDSVSKTSGTVGSKHDKANPPAAQGSNQRLPKKGKKVHWKAMPGWVKGEVIEILKSNKKVEGKDVKASKNDPRLVLKSESSGKTCVHKPDNIYFDD